MERLTSKFGAERMAMMLPHMKNVGESLGINFSYGGNIGNTLASHRLIKYADKQGCQTQVTEEIFKDFFERDQDISIVEVLANAAERAGLDKAKVLHHLYFFSFSLPLTNIKLNCRWLNTWSLTKTNR